MITQEQASKETKAYLETLDNVTGISHKQINDSMNMPYTTYKTWLYKGTYPLIKIFFHPFSLEILEFMLLLAIKTKSFQNDFRMIDIKRAMLEVEECFEIRDEILMHKAIAKVKAMLDLLTIEQPYQMQTKLVI